MMDSIKIKRTVYLVTGINAEITGTIVTAP